ncbi:MAG: AI-2E family transporter, partial [Anaerolineae bacterium]|nr:AI-2E family transporter [Anaerolineae bacterium]
GPILGLIPALLVATIQSPLLGLWTLILYLAIQQIENLILVPRISGAAVQLHPALIMVVLVLGSEMAGLVGLILAVPLTAILRDLFKYLYLRFQDEPLTPQEAMKRLGRTPLQLDV